MDESTIIRERGVIEKWRAIPGFDGYEVSNLGRVRSWRHRKVRRLGAPLILSAERFHGYERVMLNPMRRHLFVHRLVLEAFVGPCPAGQQCRHFPDATKSNNRLENLSWATPQENHDDMLIQDTRPKGARHGTHTKPDTVSRGSAVGTAKLTEGDIPKIRDLLKARMPMYKIGALFGVSKHTVYSIREGLTWRHVKSTG